MQRYTFYLRIIVFVKDFFLFFLFFQVFLAGRLITLTGRKMAATAACGFAAG